MKLLTIWIGLLLFSTSAIADVIAITDQTQWQDAIDSYTTITFTEYPAFTTITDQYADLGIVFTDDNDFIHVSGSFQTDWHGLVSTDGFGNDGTIHVSFTQPQHWLGFQFLGNLQVELYDHGQLIFSSSNYVAGFTPFVGFLSTMPFDAAIITDHADDTVAIDNMFFGPPIPTPGALALISLAAGVTFRRKKRSCCS